MANENTIYGMSDSEKDCGKSKMGKWVRCAGRREDTFTDEMPFEQELKNTG